MESMNSAVYLALTAALNPDPESPEVSILVRRAYVNPAPPPPPPEQDVVYYHLIPDGSAAPLSEWRQSGGRLSFYRYAPYLLNLTFYGPAAEANARRVSHLMTADGFQLPRYYLRRAGIYPVPGISGPVVIWEELEKQHRLRADLSVPLRAAVNETVETPSVGPVDAPPEILLRTNRPGSRSPENS